MNKIGGCLALILAVLALQGCGHNAYTTASDNRSNSSSGITVYGDIDTSIVRTR